MDKIDIMEEDIKPETYKDYKMLKADIKSQKEENMHLNKTLAGVGQETEDQREKVKIYEERIRTMEEMVGMIADNPLYTNNHLP